MISRKRKVLLELLSDVELEEPVQLPFDEHTLKSLIFDKKGDHYVFTEVLKPVLSKIDFSNISLDDVDVSGMDFTNIKGIKINPQRIYNKDLSNSICYGVEFVNYNDCMNIPDMFKEVNVKFANFKGSKGAKLNPQTINEQNLHGTVLDGLDFTGYSFDNVLINNVDFTGTKGVIINPQTIYSKTLWQTICYGVKFDGSFDGVCIRRTDFTGSIGAKVNPQEVHVEAKEGPFYKTILCDVEIIGSYDDVDVRFANFKGSKGAKLNPQTIKGKNLHGTVLYGLDFTGYLFDGVRINNVDFTGTKGVIINPQTSDAKTLWNSIFCDVEFNGSFDDVCICQANFTGSKGAIINPNKLKKSNDCPGLKGTICCDVEFTELPAEDVNTENTSFEGSNYHILSKDITEFKENIKKLIKIKSGDEEKIK